jgi:GAF domain-containing protein
VDEERIVASQRRDGSWSVTSASEVARECASILESTGVDAMLRQLNERTRFRFTGIYRLSPPLLHNLHLYDRENPALNVSGGISLLEETYCALVWSDEAPVRVTDSESDPRVVEHGARERVRSYCGVPIRESSGRVWGTLCHHDVRPRFLPRSEITVLEHVALLLAGKLVATTHD